MIVAGDNTLAFDSRQRVRTAPALPGHEQTYPRRARIGAA